MPTDTTLTESTPRNNASDDENLASDLPESRRWTLQRRSFLLGTVGVISTWIAAACGRLWPSPTPSPTASPLVPTRTLPGRTPTRRALLSHLATPRATDQATGASLDQQTYFPMIEASDTQVEAAAVPTDTATPAPPTATPRPTNTPTPRATPFPGGPPSKLGIHVERNVPELFELLKTQGMTVVTTLELDAGFAAQIKDTSSRASLIGRIHVGEVDAESLDPIPAANEFVNQLLPYADDDRRRPHFDGWISYNEPVINTPDAMKRLADFESERVRLLGDRGIRSVIGNFATGGPDLPLWEHFLPAVQTAKEYGGWLGLHEYAAPTIYYLSGRENQGRYPGISAQDEGWLTLRYRKVYNQFLKPAGLAIPLVFTECGVDGLVEAGRAGPQNARGWRDFQGYWAENGYGLWGPGAYIEQLVWFDQAMQQDDYVIGGCIYGLGTSGQWLSYDINGPALRVLEQYLSVHAEE